MKRILFLALSLAVVIASVLYTNRLADNLAEEEQRKVEIWAEATRQFILAEPGADIEFISTIIEGNTTIPVYMTDAEGNYMLCRNIELPRRLQGDDKEAEQVAYYQQQIDRLKKSCTPITVRISRWEKQYIYYDESTTLHRLQLLPYVQALLIFAFLLIAIITLSATHRAEENRVWVGLCKETAHQLGTPISSLSAWNELLRTQYPDNESFNEIERDIHRLTTITERFSKIGSRPTLVLTPIEPLVSDTISYMRTRVSNKVQLDFSCELQNREEQTMLSAQLFAWVLENLIRNAVDAGANSIQISLHEDNKHLLVDVTDSGKGIERRRWRQIFRAGYTTKQRGWGLGLSLAQRIVNDYHHGKIFVLTSEMGRGTTFRVSLKKHVF